MWIYNKAGASTVYVTEVRGVLADGSTVTPPVVDTPEVEEDTKIAIVSSPLLSVTGTTEEAVPTGFTMVSKSASFTGTLHTGTYGNKQVVAAYTDIYFAIKVTGDGTLRINGTSGFNGEWIYFHYKHNDGTSWQLSATKEDGTVVRAVALNAPNKGGNYPENAISTLIYNAGCDVDVYSASGNCAVYSTEVLGEGCTFESGIADNTMKVVTAPYRSDRVASTTEVSVPKGYSTVNKYTGSWNSDTYVHSGMMGDKTNLSDCTDLYFAMRVENGTIVIGNETYDEKGFLHGWVYFHYYRESLDTNTWSLYAKSYDGTFEKTITGIDATAGSETYPLNAISTLMYKGSSNVCVSAHKAAGATANVYVTEVLGVAPVEGDRMIWAAADGAAPIHGDLPVNYPMGFAALYEKTDFKRGGLAAMDLSSVTSTTLRFKMLSSHLLYVDKAYTDFADAKTIVIKETVENSNMYLVTLTKTEQGWHVVMDCTLSYSLDNSTWNNGGKFEFDSTEQSLSRIFKMISTASSQNVTLYVTEVRGEHTVCSASKYTYLGNGTHKAECVCGAVMIESEACSGGVATCTDGATCAMCKGMYKAALGHDKVWTDNVLSCQRDGCKIVLGTVETNLAKQNVALYTDAAAINATQSVGATIDLSGATELSISDIQNVTLGGVSYSVANFADNKVTINVLPQDVFGEYTFTATITVEGKDFEISAPVLVVTNAVTSQTGLLAMKDVLRGENGMNGDGYYLLNNHVELTYNSAYVYAFGTKTLPFVGTFDGNGYAIKYFKTAPYPSSEEEDVTYKQYVEASLFGVMDGTVKNVAMTNVVIGGMTNISHSGNGLFENVYLEVSEYNSGGSYCEPFFARAAATKTQGTLKNVVVKMKDLYNTNAWAIYQRYLNGENVNVEIFPAAVGDSFIADNVALYGYDSSLKDYERRYEDGTLCTPAGRGGVYSQGNSVISHDGKEFGIYVEYVAGGNNGGLFGVSLLDNNIWTVVNDEPIFKSLVGADEGTSPEDYLPEQNEEDVTNNYVALNGDTQYLIAWNDNAVGSSTAATIVNDVMYSATGVNLMAAKADPVNEWKKQIIIGSFEEYSSYVTGSSSWTLANDRVNYGVYLENRTIYILSDGEDGFALAAQELCRKLFGWKQLSPSQVVMNNTQTVELPAEMSYTTSISFSQRQTGTHLTDSLEMNFNCNTHPYTLFATEMHNIKEFFDKTDSTWKKYYTTTSSTGHRNENGTANDPGKNICFLGYNGSSWDFNAIVNHAVEQLVARAKELPDAKVFNLMIEDSFDYCNCSRCAQFTNKSVTAVLFMNEVAKKLQNNAELGGRTIGIEFFAYASFEKAPVVTTTEINYIKNTLGLTANTQTITYKAGSDYTVADAISAGLIGAETETVLKSEDNLRLWWTSQKANHAYALKHRANAHMYYGLQGWLGSVSAANVDVYMYQSYFQDYLMPLNTWEYQIAWYRELNELGVNGYMFNLGQYETENAPETQTGFMSFKTYIDSRALSDTTVSYETIKDEFFATDGYFGAAGPKMKEFFNSLESVLNSKKQADGLAISEYLVSKKNATTDLKIRQLYFNGFFGPSYSSLMIDYENGANNFYKLYNDDQLKQWYTYCTEALALVEGDALYEKRIKAEAIFPYYMLLLQNSNPDYNYWDAEWTFTEYGNGYTFQGLADLINAVGTTCQREHYTFEQTGKGIAWQHGTYELNLFARWGLTYNPQA
ncbi:MAG: DUF4838 domain-containing protein [Clostridia bacterium]|nr:DUF4838 domain-containing protein [Clostridia bacterium]